MSKRAVVPAVLMGQRLAACCVRGKNIEIIRGLWGYQCGGMGINYQTHTRTHTHTHTHRVICAHNILFLPARTISVAGCVLAACLSRVSLSPFAFLTCTRNCSVRVSEVLVLGG